MPNQRMTTKSKKVLIGIIVVSVILRVIAALYLGNSVEILPGTFDQISYHRLAIRVINGYGFSFGEEWWPITKANEPTSHWSFLYTLYLVFVYKVFGPNPLIARIVYASPLTPLIYKVVDLLRNHSEKKITIE